MVNYREILRLDSLNYTQRQIAASVHSSRNTISEVLHLADAKGLHWPLDDTVTNQEIMLLLYPQRKDAVNPRKERITVISTRTCEARSKSFPAMDRILQQM